MIFPRRHSYKTRLTPQCLDPIQLLLTISEDFITDGKQEYSYISAIFFPNLTHAKPRHKSSPSYFHRHWEIFKRLKVRVVWFCSFFTEPLWKNLTIILTEDWRSDFAKLWAFGLPICLISTCPHICNKAGDNAPFLHPSPAGCYGSCPTYLMILAPSLPFTIVGSFVTCQLIRPCRNITSMGRQQGLKLL